MVTELATFPRRVGVSKLRQLQDVSSMQATAGQALVFGSDGQWSPQTITPDLSAIETAIDGLETAVTAVEGDITTIEGTLTTLDGDLDTHIADTANPHAVTLAQIMTHLYAAQTGTGLALTTTITDIPGMSVTAPTAGTYLVLVQVDLDYLTTASGVAFYCNVNGSDGSATTIEPPVDWNGYVFTLIWKVTTSGTNEVIKIRAKEVVSSACFVDDGLTYMSVIKVV